MAVFITYFLINLLRILKVVCVESFLAHLKITVIGNFVVLDPYNKIMCETLIYVNKGSDIIGIKF